MNYSRKALEKYTGNLSQISSLTEMEYTAGKARGMRIWNVRPGNGLEFALLPDKCLDIANLSYKGVNINWQAKNGLAAGVYGYPVQNEFDRYFGGGMLLTCGLKNTGPDYTDEAGFYQHLHGRIGLMPCEQAWHKGELTDEDYLLHAGGVVRDSVLGGHNLTLTREIKTSLNKAEIEITDTLENHEPEDTEYVILYHFNFGFPFISPDIKLLFPKAESPVRPRSEAAKQGLGEWKIMGKAVDGYEEQCFFHDLVPDQDGFCQVKLVNQFLGIAVGIAYEKASLPILTQWKSLRSGEYVLGIEPGNSYISGLEQERKNGRIGVIKAYDTQVFRTKLSFFDDGTE